MTRVIVNRLQPEAASLLFFVESFNSCKRKRRHVNLSGNAGGYGRWSARLSGEPLARLHKYDLGLRLVRGLRGHPGGVSDQTRELADEGHHAGFLDHPCLMRLHVFV